MDRYEWTDEVMGAKQHVRRPASAAPFAALTGTASQREEVLAREILRLAEENAVLQAVIARDGDIRRVAPVLDAALKDRDRLAEENGSLRQHVQRLGDEAKRVRGIASFEARARHGDELAIAELRHEIERLKAVLAEEAERAFQEGAKRERSRIRRKLTALREASPSGPPHLYDVDVFRICPE